MRPVKNCHHVIDLIGCDCGQINSVEFWKRTLRDAAEKAKMEVLHERFHVFKPQGVTGFLLLSASHLAVHTWPEHRYAACDLFSCSDRESAGKAVEYIIKEVRHEDVVHHLIERGEARESMDRITNLFDRRGAATVCRASSCRNPVCLPESANREDR